MENLSYLDKILLDENIPNVEKDILLRSCLNNYKLNSKFSMLELIVLSNKLDANKKINSSDQLTNIIPEDIRSFVDMTPKELMLSIHSSILLYCFLNFIC